MAAGSEMEAAHYVVTAHPPGGVLLSCKCNFLSPNSTDVVIAKSRRLEFRQLSSPGNEVEKANNASTSPLPIVLTVPMNGRIVALLPIRLHHIPTSFLFVLTDRFSYAVLSYDPSVHYSIRTHASGSIRDAQILAREAESGPLVTVDHHGRCIALHLYDGFLSVLPINPSYFFTNERQKDANDTSGGPGMSFLLGHPSHFRIEERTVLDMVFLKAPPIVWPQLALLHQDSRGSQHVISHVLDLQQKSLIQYGSNNHSSGAKRDCVPPAKEWIKKSRIDGGSSLILAVPRPPTLAASRGEATGDAHRTASNDTSGGVLVVGQRQVTYHHSGQSITKIVPMPHAMILSWAAMDDPDKFLLADEFGNLLLLLILRNSPDDEITPSFVTGLQIDVLGQGCTICSSLTYLSEGLLFCGSQFGDSQLVQLKDTSMIPINDEMEDNAMMEDEDCIQVVEEYTHLGPIVDFDLVNDTDHGGACQMVTASGSSTTGSLRLVRNGIGMKDYASVEIPGIQNMWSVRKHFLDGEDGYLVQSFVGETRILGVVSTSGNMMMEEGGGGGGATLEEVVLAGFDSTCSTLYAGNIQSIKSTEMSSAGTESHCQMNDALLQITEAEIRLVDSSSLECVDSWQPPEGMMITVASANEGGQIIVVLRGGMLNYLNVVSTEGASHAKISLVKQAKMEEISCVDLNPFASASSSNKRSCIVGVGMWDDHSVRLLSLDSSSPLEELACVQLATQETDADDARGGCGPASARTNRNKMMARSLCLITLDPAATNATSSSPTGIDMLFVGLGDGTLVSYCVTNQDGLVVQSKKEVSLGTQCINLSPLRTERGGTCILATGDRPTVIYLAGGGGAAINSTPKLCYSSVHLATDGEEASSGPTSMSKHSNIVVNVSTAFSSPTLFDTKHYSLCVADDTTLTLGVMDEIQKLHVSTCRLGMAPRRVVHCDQIFAVGCITNASSADELSMGNCIRFLDDSTFEDLERVDLEPYEMILSMLYTQLCVAPSNGWQGKTKSTDAVSTAESSRSAAVYKSFLVVGTAYALPDEDEPSRGRIMLFSVENKGSDKSGLSRTVRLVTELQVRGGVYSMCEFYGGTFLATINSKTQVCRLLMDDVHSVPELSIAGIGHHGHIISLFVKSMAGKSRMAALAAADTNDTDKDDAMGGLDSSETEEQKVVEIEQIAIVGDLMRSISVVQYYPKNQVLEEVARDFNDNWTTAVEMLTEDVYLGAENWNNLFVLRRNTEAQSEEVRCRLDTVGEFHLGEMCNKLMRGSLVMPHNSASTLGRQNKAVADIDVRDRDSAKSPSGKMPASGRARKPIVTIGSQTLFGTVDGTIGSILGLDRRTAAFFSTLECAITRTIQPVGNFGQGEFRAFEAERRLHPTHGFVDGDLVESFLDFDRNTMKKVVREMNRDGGWQMDDHFSGDLPAAQSSSSLPSPSSTRMQEGNVGKGGHAIVDEIGNAMLSVDDVLAMVEEMVMLH